MKIPNYENAIIALNKIDNYLLSTIHITGRSKAKFFLKSGFDSNSLLLTLRKHISENEIKLELESNFGKKYIIEGEIVAPNGRKYKLCSVWIIESNQRIPYFVTVYPNK